MNNEEYDIHVFMHHGEPVILGQTQKGSDFIFSQSKWSGVQEFLDAVPPGLRVGLLNPETNLFAQLPPRSLH